MANDFSAIGFRAETDDELRRIYEENRARLCRTETAEGRAEVLALPEGPELWFYGYPGQAADPALCEPCFRTGEALDAVACGVFACEESPCPVLELEFSGDLPFRLFMLRLDHLGSRAAPGGRCRVRPALFIQGIRVYADRWDFLRRQPGSLDCPSALPRLDLSRGELREPLATLAANVTGAERRRNSLTGEEFALLTLDCLGLSFSGAVDLSLLGGVLPEAGSVVSCSCWVCGTVEMTDAG